MAKGIIYVMTTAVNGLIKIGMTQNFQQRMDYLEKNGYYNVTALKRRFAIEVDDYDKKEMMLKIIFDKSRIMRKPQILLLSRTFLLFNFSPAGDSRTYKRTPYLIRYR